MSYLKKYCCMLVLLCSVVLLHSQEQPSTTQDLITNSQEILQSVISDLQMQALDYPALLSLMTESQTDSTEQGKLLIVTQESINLLSQDYKQSLQISANLKKSLETQQTINTVLAIGLGVAVVAIVVESLYIGFTYSK